MGKEHTSSYGALAGQSTPPPGLSSGTQGFSSLIICTSTLPYNTTTLDKNEVQLHNRNASRPEQMSEHNAMPGRHGHYPGVGWVGAWARTVLLPLRVCMPNTSAA